MVEALSWCVEDKASNQSDLRRNFSRGLKVRLFLQDTNASFSIALLKHHFLSLCLDLGVLDNDYSYEKS